MKPYLSLCLAGAFFLTGCSKSSTDTTDQNRFGTPYRLETSLTPLSPDEYPILRNDSLIVRVSYTGGCNDHDFSLESEVVQDTAKIWLHHDSRGDECTETVFDEYRFDLPRNVTRKNTLIMLDPEGGLPHIVREPKWVRPAANPSQ